MSDDEYDYGSDYDEYTFAEAEDSVVEDAVAEDSFAKEAVVIPKYKSKSEEVKELYLAFRNSSDYDPYALSHKVYENSKKSKLKFNCQNALNEDEFINEDELSYVRVFGFRHGRKGCYCVSIVDLYNHFISRGSAFPFSSNGLLITLSPSEKKKLKIRYNMYFVIFKCRSTKDENTALYYEKISNLPKYKKRLFQFILQLKVKKFMDDGKNIYLSEVLPEIERIVPRFFETSSPDDLYFTSVFQNLKRYETKTDVDREEIDKLVGILQSSKYAKQSLEILENIKDNKIKFFISQVYNKLSAVSPTSTYEYLKDCDTSIIELNDMLVIHENKNFEVDRIRILEERKKINRLLRIAVLQKKK